jgi:hypothetical protein
MLGVASNAHAGKLWFVSNVSGADGSGVRFEAGQFLVDLKPSFTKPASGSNTFGLYVDAYKGDWGLGLQIDDLLTVGNSTTNKQVLFQFAKETVLCAGVSIGAAINVVDYTLAGTNSGQLKLLQSYSSYLVFDI